MSRGPACRVSSDLSASEFDRECRRAGFDRDACGDWLYAMPGRVIRFRSCAPSRRERLREMLEARERLVRWLVPGVSRG